MTIQELIVDDCHGITRYKPEGDKIMRLHAQTATIDNGFVHIPEAAPWLAEYLHEMTVFPRGKHDDQVDSTAQFLDWLKMPMASWGIYEATRRRGNRHLTVGLLDGIVEMSAEDAEYLIPAGWIKLAD